MFKQRLWTVILSVFYLQEKTLAVSDYYTVTEAIINSTLKSSVSPCEDFYAHACGNYNEQHPSNLYSDILSFVDHQYNSAILNLIESYYQPMQQVSGPRQSFVEKVRIYLAACRTETHRNLTRYFEEIKPALQTNWPILEEVAVKSNQTHRWLAGTDFDIWSLLGKLQSYGLNDVLIYQEILIGEGEEISIKIEPFESVANNTLPDVKILHVLLMKLGVENPVKIIKTLRKTNKILLSILKRCKEGPEETLEMTYGDLELFYPNLNLCSYLSELLGKQLPADTVILLKYPDYFQYLNDKLWLTFEQQDLCNYLMMKFLYFLALDSTVEFSSMACVIDLRRKLDLAVNFIYYHHIYAYQAELINSDIEEIFKAVFDTLAIHFQCNYLKLTNSQVELLLNKLAKVRLNVGNLPKDVTFAKVEEFYSTLPPLDERNYYKNHLLMLRHRFAKSLSYQKNQTQFTVSNNEVGSSSGAFYVVEQHMIILPFASLMKPMYDINYTSLTKYSILGFVLAHELAHAFDTNGLNFNGDGQVATDVASVLQNKNFQNSIKCLQSQLPTNSIDELIADIVGIQVVKNIITLKCKHLRPSEAHRYWKKYFFLHVAQFFCNKRNVKHIDHDSDGDRLNQIAMNFEGFSQVFQCCEGSKMNPFVKCRVY